MCVDVHVQVVHIHHIGPMLPAWLQLFDVYGYYSLNERQSCLTYDDVSQV